MDPILIEAWNKAFDSFLNKKTNILCYNLEELGELSDNESSDGLSNSSTGSDDIDESELMRRCAREAAISVNNTSLEETIFNLLNLSNVHLEKSFNTIYDTCAIVLDPEGIESDTENNSDGQGMNED